MFLPTKDWSLLRAPWFAAAFLMAWIAGFGNASAEPSKQNRANPSTIAKQTSKSHAITFASVDGDVQITSEFAGGRMNGCQQVSASEFAITIHPERDQINDSAWYAFRIDSTQPRDVCVRLNYVGGSHRYDPKVSRDGKTWMATPQWVTKRHPLGSEVELSIPLDGKPIWIAGQELIGGEVLQRWTDTLESLPYVNRSVIGQSVQGRPLHRLDITDADRPDYVFIVARQHPPEVSGAIGMMHFVETIADASPLSEQFRSRYCAAVVPMVNPDGVAQGHWRCNANGVDLNRDWAHFSQPETKAVVNQLLACRKTDDGRLCLFIDFHSTFDDVFYTTPPKANLFPQGFTDQWLGAIQGRFPAYEVNRKANHNLQRSTSKAYVARTLGVTAITYEFGDETDRETIRTVASGAAEEMMRLLVNLPAGTAEPSIADRGAAESTDLVAVGADPKR
ncbi:Zinc carboxypeptidase [Rubripirellula lacrimiformis]|uniref:Zinc carboxypeptidase n=1 Tax=Rubripirellula lacrimiformis TaxID=1930273 RepID=A0A517N595_9BACT|nr:M14-type cytosolic carboxypeptidase [Rubripirellula lacrimiformis]QDT02309.1 Zinc carboxypeptidase [Rubripirellula lacrimiformis]